MPPCPRRLVFVGPRAALARVPLCDPRGAEAAHLLEPRVGSLLLEFASCYQACEQLSTLLSDSRVFFVESFFIF